MSPLERTSSVISAVAPAAAVDDGMISAELDITSKIMIDMKKVFINVNILYETDWTGLDWTSSELCLMTANAISRPINLYDFRFFQR